MAPASAGSAPSVDMLWADVSRTNQSAITFYLMTNSTIKNLEASDFYVFGSATGCAVDDGFSQASFHVVTVRGCSDGTVAVQLGANSVSDLNMNWGPAQGAVSDFTTIDRIAPTFAFDSSLTSTADSSFTLTALVSEQVQQVDTLMTPTVSGEGCSLSGVIIAADNYTFAITGCKPGADAQVTVLANSFKDATGNTGPAQNAVSQIVKVQVVAPPVATSSPSPTLPATSTASPTPTPPATPTASPTPEATAAAAPLVVQPPIDPPQPPAPETPVLSQVLTPVLDPEAEPVVPMAPIASIRALEAASSFELAAPPAPRRASSAVQTKPVQPETLTNPVPAPKTEPVIEPELQIAARASAPEVNLGWVMPAASVVSALFGAIAGALIVRNRLSRRPRLTMA